MDTDRAAVQMQLPPALVALPDEFASVFDSPSGLPPVRDCDHTVPLIEGATPVNVRPYRYPPALKGEIER
jgi:hypothetical protein